MKWSNRVAKLSLLEYGSDVETFRPAWAIEGKVPYHVLKVPS